MNCEVRVGKALRMTQDFNTTYLFFADKASGERKTLSNFANQNFII